MCVGEGAGRAGAVWWKHEAWRAGRPSPEDGPVQAFLVEAWRCVWHRIVSGGGERSRSNCVGARWCLTPPGCRACCHLPPPPPQVSSILQEGSGRALLRKYELLLGQTMVEVVSELLVSAGHNSLAGGGGLALNQSPKETEALQGEGRGVNTIPN